MFPFFEGSGFTIGALIIKIGSWAPSHYDCNKDAPNSIGNY